MPASRVPVFSLAPSLRIRSELKFEVPKVSPARRDYYGYYSNVSRGKRKKQNLVELIPCILELDDPLESISPVIMTQDIVAHAYRGVSLGLTEKIMQAHEELSKNNDVLIM